MSRIKAAAQSTFGFPEEIIEFLVKEGFIWNDKAKRFEICLALAGKSTVRVEITEGKIYYLCEDATSYPVSENTLGFSGPDGFQTRYEELLEFIRG